jgi:hypothetical protein
MVVGGAAIVLFLAAAPVGLPFATVAQAQPRATVRYVVVPDRVREQLAGSRLPTSRTRCASRRI